MTSLSFAQGSKRCPLSEADAAVLLASGTNNATTQVDVHPVVFLHIADHYHRNVAQHAGKLQVYGALLGRQDGSKTEICFAFEIKVDVIGKRLELDKTYWLMKEVQFKQIFPDLDYIGWYCVSDEYLTMNDLDLQNQFWEVSQNPFLLKTRPGKPDAFPADLFESIIEFVSGEPKVKFIPVEYNMVFEDSEQVGVNHIATKADTETAESATGENEYQISMRSMTSAVRMLQERLSVICQYVRAVEAGTLPPDNEILIELKRIIDLLESLDSDEQKEKYSVMRLQAIMTSSVGIYAQTVEGMIDFIRKNVVVIDRRGQQKMMRAMGGPGGFPHRGPGGFFSGQNKGLRRDGPKPSSSRSKGMKLFSFGKSDADTDSKSTGSSFGEHSKGDVHEP
ncbi:hypothetical protein RvY_12915 [Ramazzottius varieornatus]|uniref:COP9 signalosome complex subunit 6 n=1 Tax=Ramazzottius varieornatus TaxID=947166 RepID=A0A1D1VL33_RAMVA|nr:hypothetical protein RvY_12915 [Ramazzottius varieornatus]